MPDWKDSTLLACFVATTTQGYGSRPWCRGADQTVVCVLGLDISTVSGGFVVVPTYGRTSYLEGLGIMRPQAARDLAQIVAFMAFSLAS